MSKVLILTDGKAGHENQSKAFARALGCGFDLVEVHFKSKYHKLLSYIFDHLRIRSLFLFLATEGAQGGRKALCPPCASEALCGEKKYCGVIGTGSGTFYAAKAMARKLGVKCGVVLYPRGYDIRSFDCVLAPAFDRPKSAANVIEIPANLVANDESFYQMGVDSFLSRKGVCTGEAAAKRSLECCAKGTQGDAVAVIVGGPNKCSTMTPEWMKSQLDAIFNSNTQTLQNSKTEFWVTTSRRTPPAVEAVVDSYPWDYKLLYSKDHFNPIPAFVKLAKKLYVTAESTGMLSESCTFGTAEVVALDNLKPGPHKFRRFVEDLRTGGYVDGNRKVDLSAQFARAKALMGLS